MPAPIVTSYLLAALAVLVVLNFHILSAVLAGLAVYVLTAKMARRLPPRWGAKAHGVALVAILLIVVLLVTGLFFGLRSFLQGHDGMASLMAAVAERLDNLKRNSPPELTGFLPDDEEDLREQLANMFRQHGKNISHAGMSGVRTIAHVLFGTAIGSIAVLHRFRERHEQPPLAAALHARLGALAAAFDKVVFAQVKISALNTTLTGIYLFVILPLCGVHMPMATLLILLTFVAGLLPVIGNLISNTVIVVISLGISSAVGAASLVFLLLIHKLEYFTNAKIVGSQIEASAWELLSAMLVMEAIFGMAGMIAAPILYAWLKAELTALELV